MKRVLLTEQELSSALSFYKNYLGLKEVNIRVVLDDTMHLMRESGACAYLIDESSYRIRLCPFYKLLEPHPLETLAHELVHVKQYNDGILFDDPIHNIVWWKGKAYLDPSDQSDTYYKTCPWEQQAFNLQRRIYNAYLESTDDSIYRRADGSDRQ